MKFLRGVVAVSQEKTFIQRPCHLRMTEHSERESDSMSHLLYRLEVDDIRRGSRLYFVDG